MEWHSWHSGDGGFPQIEKKLTDIGYQIIKLSPAHKAVGRDGQVGLFLAQNLNFSKLKDYGEIPGGKMNSNLFFIHSTEPIQKNFGRNTDGLEILDCHLFYRPLTKEKDGLQW